ncbi:MAG: hypothetical protein ACI4EJ_01690 [Bacteroides sp.]
MKIYAIYDKEVLGKQALGYLFYYEKSNEYIIELIEGLDEWDAPILFQGLVRKNIYTVPKDISALWVKERVIPSGRQNIGNILKNAKMKEYNEMALLALSKGKCSQDSCYIEEISCDDLPEEIRKRSNNNINECFVAENKQIICMFKDNTVRKLDLSELKADNKDISYILKNDDLLHSVKVGVGGYSISFNDTIEISSAVIREKGVLLPITANDILAFVRTNIVNTTTSCEMLQCSRQNLSYLVKTKKITPIIYGTKENLYTKGDIERIMYD